MAPRSNWKGYLKLSLVSCPVQLFPATTTKERVAFHLLNRETGHRLRRKLIDPETDETVESDDQVKGYEVAKNEYVLVEEDEIASVAIESTHTIDIETFVPKQEIDAAFLDTPYYLAPNGAIGEEAFAVIREAMREKGVVGIGRVVLYRRERPIMLEPRGKGLVATTLKYAYEVRDDAEYFEDIGDVKVPDEMLDLATHIIGRKMAHFDAKRFEDRYQDALLDLIKAKQHHRTVKAAPSEPPRSNVVSLMDALRKSIAADPGAAKAAARDAAAEPPGGGEAEGSAKREKPGRSKKPAEARDGDAKATRKGEDAPPLSDAPAQRATKPAAAKKPPSRTATASAPRLKKTG